MLTNADKKIIARDMDLPGLFLLLDPEALLARLQNLPRFNHAVKADIRYLRYKPANSCACTVRIELGNGSYLHYYAKALTRERFVESWNRSSRQKLIKAGDPLAPLAIPDGCIMLLHPAYDREIGHLKWLINEEYRLRLLKTCSLPEINHESWHVDILRYKPERRLVAKVSRDNRPVAIIRTATPKAFGKMLVGSAFGVAHGGMSLLGADGATCTLATGWQKGRSLCPENGILPSGELVKKLARKLGRIHRSSNRHPIKYTWQDEMQSLYGVMNTFKSILPEHTEWFQKLLEQTEQGGQEIPACFSLIHGDFSLDQIVQRQNKAGEIKLHILDWDRSSCGHPFFDLAAFRARLELQVIEGFIDRWQADEILTVLFDTYKEEVNNDLSGLHWFVASALLRLATEPFRKRDPNWEHYTLQLLQRTEDILAKGESRTANIAEAQSLLQDAVLPILLNAKQMQERMRQARILPETMRIGEVKLSRYKPGRRALIGYHITKPHGHKPESLYLIGKYRVKGLDKRSYRVQQQLWQAGFDDRAKVSVPEVAGTLPELNLWFQRRLNAQSIGELLTPTNARLAFLGRAVAGAIVALHQSRVAQKLSLPVWTAENELAVLRDRLEKFLENRPHFQERIQAILAGCEALAAQLTDIEFVTVHRDFYQDQVQEFYGEPGHIAIVDLDLVCQGHAALDAGNYIAHIQELALRLYGDITVLKAHHEAFKQRFLSETDSTAAHQVDIYTTLSLVRHIHISTLFEKRTHTTEQLLKLCENRLNSHFTN